MSNFPVFLHGDILCLELRDWTISRTEILAWGFILNTLTLVGVLTVQTCWYG